MSSIHLPKSRCCLIAAVVIAVSVIFHFIAGSLGFQKYAAFIRRKYVPCT